jgi:hypothetical protein
VLLYIRLHSNDQGQSYNDSAIKNTDSLALELHSKKGNWEVDACTAHFAVYRHNLNCRIWR